MARGIIDHAIQGRLPLARDVGTSRWGAARVDRASATLAQRRTPPVLTKYLGMTVGGTLSAGGFGITTHRYGAQVDQVRELEVVTGEANVVRCSEREQRALFEAALAGQGQCGIITRVVLNLSDASDRV